MVALANTQVDVNIIRNILQGSGLSILSNFYNNDIVYIKSKM